MLTQREIREKVTDQIVTALRAGTVPFWRQPWSHAAGLPANAVSGKPYRGINHLLTSLAAQTKGYESRWWATLRQWNGLGGWVRKGEKGTTIILYKPVPKTTVNEEGDEQDDSFLVLRSWTVFNVAQVNGHLDRFRTPTRRSQEAQCINHEAAEQVLTATQADIRFGGGRAFYSPSGDFIQMPPKQAFQQAQEYYGVLSHELMHWTGHRSRLNRLPRLSRFGDEAYAMEELVAELGSAFLLAEIGVPQSDDLSNVTAYLAHWLAVLERDPQAIFSAASASSQAVDFALSFSRSPEEEAVEEPVPATT